MTRRISLTVFAALSAILGTTAVQANPVSISAQVATGSNTAPFSLFNAGTSSSAGRVANSITMNGAQVTFVPNATSGGIYAGGVAGIAASPFSNATQNYFAAEPNDPIKFVFNAARTTFDLL